jgi:surfactin synthase thioesterase subunit
MKQDVNVNNGIALRLSAPFSVDIHSMGANIATETITFVHRSIPICPRKMYRRAQAKPDLSPALQGFAPAQSKPSTMNVVPLHNNDQK